MFAGKPIIGLAGGIGSGKSYVARLFGELGCRVIDSDEQVRRAYQDPQVKQTLRQWWGEAVFDANGEIDRSAVARLIFADPKERQRLEQLLHPMVAQMRQREMESAANDAQVVAFVWDTPLLFETGLNSQCDAVVFVDAPWSDRLARVQRQRGWSGEELARREKLQMPLDKKASLSDHVVRNTAGANDDVVRAQVREVLSRILAATVPTTDRH
ncbi:dephospho-CoA kinase [Fontivita pretiosa]|uniref:dephospho-CoA kinase n=1 Tax=Fontivita pretiosa TaxID=2989684 RepID=UPI003D168969